MLQADAKTLGTEQRWIIRVMDAEEVAHFWPQIEEALDAQPELWDTFYTKDFLYKAVLSGEVFFIACAKDEVIVLLTMCAVVSFPAARRLQVFWMHGEGLEEAGALLALAIENFAALTECQFIDGYGRRGWEKFCKRFGYEFVRVHVTKPVNYMRQ